MKKNTIVSVIIFAIIFGIIYYDVTCYYPEKFKVRELQVSMLSVAGKDSALNCFKLIDSIDLNDSTQEVLLAIRFKLDYISLVHEHFWNKPKAPPGAFGHTDTIINIDIADKHSNHIDMNDLRNASAYADFDKDHVTDQFVNSHHIGHNGCYSAQTFNSINKFVDSYNNNDPLESLHVLYMDDYHFFRVSHKVARQIKNNGSKFIISLKDSTKVEAYIH